MVMNEVFFFVLGRVAGWSNIHTFLCMNLGGSRRSRGASTILKTPIYNFKPQTKKQRSYAKHEKSKTHCRRHTADLSGQFHLMMRCAAPLFMFALVFEGV